MAFRSRRRGSPRSRVPDAPAPEPRPLTPIAKREPVLKISGLYKRFGSVQVLSDVDLELYPREVVAIVGDNAAGKSTLAKIIAGVYQPDAGTIELQGKRVSIPSPAAAVSMGIATVFQDLALADNLDLASNLFLGREMGRAGVMERERMEQTARAVLSSLTNKITSVRIPAAELSGGQRQIVAVARALLGNPKIVILDEPTAALSVAQSAEVLNLIERLRALEHGVIVISHNLVDVQAVSDRIVVLRHGRNNGTFYSSDIGYEDIIAAITGAKVDLSRPLHMRDQRPGPRQN